MSDISDASFDHAFAFEATCHANDLLKVYKEILRVLKPGGMFLDMAWCVTDDYNPEDPKHVKVINDVMVSIHMWSSQIIFISRILFQLVAIVLL